MSSQIITVTHEILPGRERPVAILRLGGSETPITWSRARLDALAHVLDQVDPAEVEAVVLVGTDYAFGVGADLDELGAIDQERAAEQAARTGWRAFRRLDALPVPSFALLTGYALGGGMELALFATCRIARSDVKGLGLPEARLGLIPGWGGVHRIARLAGPETALNIAVFESLAGRFRSAEEALDDRLVDTVIAAEDWDDGWRAWVSSQLAAGAIERSAPATETFDADTWRSAIDAIEDRTTTLPPASASAIAGVIDLTRRARSETLDEAEDATSEMFGRLLVGPDARAALYADRLLRTRAKPRQASQEQTVRSAAVIGAGLMAAQLATLLVQHAQIPVTLTDVTVERAETGARRVRERLQKAERSGKLPTGDAERLGALVRSTTSLEDISGVDFVIEAIFEELDAKKSAFAEAEKYVSPTTVLATNTSSLSITAIAEGLQHPNRVVGFHVFNPVSVVPLVEIIPAGTVSSPVTNETTLGVVSGLAARLRRRPVLSADYPGFIVNRLITRLLDGVNRAIDAGADPVAADHALDPIGLPMTPLQLVDFVGPAVQLHVSQTMHDAYPDRFAPPLWLERLVASGGPEAPARVYGSDGALTPAAIAALPERTATTSRGVDVLLSATLDALAEEIHLMLDERVVAEVEDIDVALLLGANYPRGRGGLTPYLDANTWRTAPFHP